MITFTTITGSYRFPNHQGLCTTSSCPRKYHLTCLICISLNGIHSSAYLAEQGKDYSYLITRRLQAISCKDLTSKKLLTPLVSRKPEGETVKQDKQSLNYQGQQEDVLNPITYVKVNTWPGLHGQEHLLRNAWWKRRRATTVTDRTNSLCYLSLQEFSWKQPSDNLNSFPLLVAGACFCWHTKTQELWNT